MPHPRPQRILGIGYLTHITAHILETHTSRSYVSGVPDFLGINKAHIPQLNYPTILLSDDCLPFDDYSFDLVIALHSLENTHNQQKFLRELWRVLDHKGALIVIVPNKLSTWCRSESTPFSRGNAFTTHQLMHLFHRSRFAPLGFEKFLFAPPFLPCTYTETYTILDRIMRYLVPTGGLLLGKAEKRLLIHPPQEQEPSLSTWLKQKIIPGSVHNRKNKRGYPEV